MPQIEAELRVSAQMPLIKLIEIDSKDVHFRTRNSARMPVVRRLNVELRSASEIVRVIFSTSSFVVVNGGVNFRMLGSYWQKPISNGHP